MNYINFYRKYRPNFFRHIIGQKKIVDVLKSSIRQNKIHHAYLFAGMQGVGKTSTARIFARAINCLTNQLGEICNKCSVCQQNQVVLEDIIEIDAASHNGVEQIRNLKENAIIAPNNSQYKVFIIDEVHMLSKNAFNAFLKLLEEPPTHVIFILATTEIAKIPQTILSRCQHFHFHKIDNETMVRFLTQIANQELLSFHLSALETIANYSNGCVRDALNILEQLSYIHIDGSVQKQDVLSYFGFLDLATQVQFLFFLFHQKQPNLTNMIKSFAKSSVDFLHLSTEILELLKNYLLYRMSDKNPDLFQTVFEQINFLEALTVFQLRNVINLIFQFLPQFRYQLKSELLFELLCLRIVAFLQDSKLPPKHIITKSESFQTTHNQETINKIDPTVLLNVLNQKDLTIFQNVKKRWQFVETYLNHDKFRDLALLFNQCVVVTCSKTTILLQTRDEKIRNQINNLKHDSKLKLFSKEWLLDIYHFYVVTQDELMALKLSYQKKSKED